MTKRRNTARMSKQALVREAARRKHASEYARMNERRAPKRATPAASVDQPRYLAERARDILRGVARLAMLPFALARAVAERFRDRQLRES
jgi:hypothetical protein